jgi:hypothetical protein
MALQSLFAVERFAYEAGMACVMGFLAKARSQMQRTSFIEHRF